MGQLTIIEVLLRSIWRRGTVRALRRQRNASSRQRRSKPKDGPSWLVAVVYATAIGIANGEVATEQCSAANCRNYTGTNKPTLHFTLMTRVATGSRFVYQPLHTEHYAAPPKNVTWCK